LEIKRMIIIALMIAIAVASVIPATAAQAETKPSLKLGDWVKLSGTYVKTSEGTIGWNGTYKYTEIYTVLITISSIDPGTIVLSRHVEGTGVCTATGNYDCGDHKTEDEWSWTNDRTYTIDRASMKVTAASNDRDKSRVGHPSQYLIDPSLMTDGGSTLSTFWIPNSDAKGGGLAEVLFDVSKETVDIRGAQLAAWKVSHTGDTLGDWSNADGVYSKGQATITFLYDPLYGIVVGASFPWNTSGLGVDGKSKWTENGEETWKLVDTNLVFTVPMTLKVEPTTGVAISVDGAKYTADQLQVFNWVIGTTHTLQVDPKISGASGVRYLFVKWSDGSTDTSCTLTATQAVALSATFKTQYQLTVVSDLGNPQGSGWYDSGTQATFSVTSPQPGTDLFGTIGGKQVFQAWTGDSSSSSPTDSITMSGPKTVRALWTTDNSQAYMVLAGIIIVIVLVVVVLLVVMRRKKPTQ
jgi:hypothetical protein